MDPGMIGLIGGIGGSLIGLAGALLGVRASVLRTESPAERAFVIRTAAAAFLAVLLFIGVPLWLTIADVIPWWGYWIGFGAFFGLLGPTIRWVNRHQQELRARHAE